MGKFLRYAIVLLVCLTGLSFRASAQFKEQAFTQSYNDADSTSTTDTSASMFSFREMFGGLAHKRDARIGIMLTSGIVMPGTFQIYNKDYWKLPIVYGGIGVCAGLGGYYLHQYNLSKKTYKEAYALDPNTPITVNKRYKNAGTWLMVGAGLLYWGSLMDGAVSYHNPLNPEPNAGKATVYSILLPGLGQAYNGEYWKIPIYWGCLLGSAHYYYLYRKNFRRYKSIYYESFEDGYSGPVSQSTAEYYKDVYRRYRDYSVLAIVGFYLLQVIDANVFAYMRDFDVSNDISMRIEPAVICPDDAFALNYGGPSSPLDTSIGLRIGIKF